VNWNADPGNPFFSWSDGTPDAVTNSTQGQVFTQTLNGGFQISVPADPTTRTLRVYVGLTGAQGQLVAHLSDGSAVDFVDSSVSATSGVYEEAAYTLNYSAASAGQTLTVTWTLASGLVIFFHAAALNPTGGGGGNPGLNGSFADISPTTSSINLTAMGAQDWAHWGYAGSPGYDHKAGGGLLGTVVPVAGASMVQTSDPNTPFFSWSDGTPDPNVASTQNFLYNTFVGGGLQFLAPADPTPRILKVYVGLFNSTGRLTAHLGDGSSPDFVDTGVSSSGYREVVYTINYYAATVGQSLVVTWSLQSGSVVFLHAALLNPPASSGLSGSYSDISPTSSVNLTALSAVDWAHWGFNGSPGYDHKSGGGTISSISAVTGATLTQTNDPGTPLFNWSDGIPDISVTNTQNEIYTTILGGGLQFTAPADTSQRTLKVYVGLNGATGKLTAHLSDGSSSDFVSTAVTATAGSYHEVIYTLNYAAASPGQTLTVTWTLQTGTVVFLHAAALTAAGGSSNLNYSVADIPGTSSVNLTALGGADWAHWGYTSPTVWDHKSSGGGMISPLSVANGASLNEFNDTNTPMFSWSDGTPDGVVSNTQNQVYSTYVGGSLKFAVPADTSTRTLQIYVGVSGGSGQLTAHLTDSSSPDIIDSSVTTSSGMYRESIYTIHYAAASAGQSLNLTWALISGSVEFLHAALLSAPSTPTPTPFPSFTRTPTPIFTSTPTLTPSRTSTTSPTQTATASPTATQTATQTATMTNTPSASPTATPTCLSPGQFGNLVPGSSNWNADGSSFNSSRFVLIQDGSLLSESIYISALSGNYRLAVYADNAGQPGALLSQAGPFVATLGWNTQPMPSVHLAAGTYWLAFQAAPNLQVAFSTGTSGIEAYRSGTGFTAFSDPFGTATSGNTLWSIYASFCPDLGYLVTATATPSSTPTCTPIFSATPSWTPTSTATPTFSSTLTLTSTYSSTLTPTPTATPTYSSTLTLSSTLTATPTDSSTLTLTSTLTATPSYSSTLTLTSTLTVTPTYSTTLTLTSTLTPSPSFSSTWTLTPTDSSTLTPTPTPSPTLTPSYSSTPLPTATDTATHSPTQSQTSSPTLSSTAPPSPSDTATRTATAQATATSTAMPSASVTVTASPSFSPAFSATTTRTATAPPTATPPPTPAYTHTTTLTPAPTFTAEVPAVTDRNVFRPTQGGKLQISFKAPQDGKVSVKVYNLAGQMVMPVFEAQVQAGLWFQANWDGKNEVGSTVSSGIYFISIRGAGIRSVKKVILLK
jgi:hypothetical protein